MIARTPRLKLFSMHFCLSFLKKVAGLFLIHFFFFMSGAFASDSPFNNPSNWGGTGLLEIPTARIIDDGVMRIGYAQADPYRWYTGGMGIFPGLEFSGRFTEMTNLESGMEGYGHDRDKAFDLKYQIWPESEWLPATAIGIHDFHGTRLFPAKYLAFSRQFRSFDFTAGVGTERLGGDGGASSSEKIGGFGGVEWALHERIHLLAEYNPVKYEKDKTLAVPEGADSPLNAGIRINIFPGIKFGLSYQRGDTGGFMFHLESELGKPITYKKADPPLWASVDRRSFGERDPREMVEKIRAAIEEAGFQMVSVYTDGKDLTAEFENNKYIDNPKAAGRVLRILLFYSPNDTQYLHAILKRQKIPILKVSVRPDYLEKYLLDKIPESTFLEFAKVENLPVWGEKDEVQLIQSESGKFFYHYFGIKPGVEIYFNDPSGVLKSRFGIKPYVQSTLWKGAGSFARYDLAFYSDIESSNNPIPDAVRSDSWKYLDDGCVVDKLIFNQALKLTAKTFAGFRCGYFEKMYAGVGGELLTFIGDGRLAVGVEGDWVRKREPDTQMDLMNFESHTMLANAYYNLNGVDIIHQKRFDLTFHAQYGRYLAGDCGWLFNISRQYDNGVIIGCWYSVTDTDDLTDVNVGYHDKGVFLSMPVRMFVSHETSRLYGYSISPWTRDVAVSVFHLQTLYNLASDLMPGSFKNDMEKLKE